MLNNLHSDMQQLQFHIHLDNSSADSKTCDRNSLRLIKSLHLMKKEPSFPIQMEGNCTQNADCSGHGLCIHNVCECDQLRGGSYCQYSTLEQLGVGFQVWKFFFLSMYLLLASFICWQMYPCSTALYLTQTS
jgi:hypothetical protein